MKTSEQIGKFAEALAKAQGMMKAAVFDATNPFFKSKYATLASIMDACREPLSANGIAVIQGGSVEDKKLTVTTMLIHSSGEFISDELTMTITKDAPQDIGSALTYARRYSISSMVGIVSDNDDDAEGSKDNKPAAKKSNPKPAQSKKPHTDVEKLEKKRQEDIKQVFALAKKTGLETDQKIKASIENIIDRKILSSSELNIVEIAKIIEHYSILIEAKETFVDRGTEEKPAATETQNTDDKQNTETSLDKLKLILANKELKASSMAVCKSMGVTVSELRTAPEEIITEFVNKVLGEK